MGDVSDHVVAVISRKIRYHGADSLSATDKLADLGLESVEYLELVFELEEEFDVQIPYNANTAANYFASVQDVVDAIQGLVEQKS